MKLANKGQSSNGSSHGSMGSDGLLGTSPLDTPFSSSSRSLIMRKESVYQSRKRNLMVGLSADKAPRGLGSARTLSRVQNIAAFVPEALFTLVADNMLEGDLKPMKKRISGACMLADLSGFTRTSEQLSAGGASGLDELSNLINRCFEDLIDSIASHGGDVLKFAGDALLVVWDTPTIVSHRKTNETQPEIMKSGKLVPLAEAVLRAVQCGTDLAKLKFDHDLSLHIGITAGVMELRILGGVHDIWDFLVEGDPIVMLGDVESMAKSGELVISNECYTMINDPLPSILECKELSTTTPLAHGGSRSCWKVLSVKEPIPAIALQRRAESLKIDSESQREQERANDGGRELSESERKNNKSIRAIVEKGGGGGFDALQIGAALKLLAFFPQPLSFTAMDEINQTNFTEVRNVSCLFFSFDGPGLVSEDDSRPNTPRVQYQGQGVFARNPVTMTTTYTPMQQCLVKCQRILFSLDGFMRQFIVDDKGCVLIACFGVPRFFHEDDAVRALHCALQVKEELCAEQINVNVGITTGSAFCGLVGAAKRSEYVVIGDVVNTSARLMCLSKDIGDQTERRLRQRAVMRRRRQNTRGSGAIFTPVPASVSKADLTTARLGSSAGKDLEQADSSNLMHEKRYSVDHKSGNKGNGESFSQYASAYRTGIVTSLNSENALSEVKRRNEARRKSVQASSGIKEPSSPTLANLPDVSETGTSDNNDEVQVGNTNEYTPNTNARSLMRAARTQSTYVRMVMATDLSNNENEEAAINEEAPRWEAPSSTKWMANRSLSSEQFHTQQAPVPPFRRSDSVSSRRLSATAKLLTRLREEDVDESNEDDSSSDGDDSDGEGVAADCDSKGVMTDEKRPGSPGSARRSLAIIGGEAKASRDAAAAFEAFEDDADTQAAYVLARSVVLVDETTKKLASEQPFKFFPMERKKLKGRAESVLLYRLEGIVLFSNKLGNQSKEDDNKGGSVFCGRKPELSKITLAIEKQVGTYMGGGALPKVATAPPPSSDIEVLDAELVDEDAIKSNGHRSASFLIEGPPGIGKSTLLNKACRFALSKGMHVILVHMLEYHSKNVFSAFSHLFRSIINASANRSSTLVRTGKISVAGPDEDPTQTKHRQPSLSERSLAVTDVDAKIDIMVTSKSTRRIVDMLLEDMKAEALEKMAAEQRNTDKQVSGTSTPGTLPPMDHRSRSFGGSTSSAWSTEKDIMFSALFDYLLKLEWSIDAFQDVVEESASSSQRNAEILKSFKGNTGQNLHNDDVKSRVKSVGNMSNTGSNGVRTMMHEQLLVVMRSRFMRRIFTDGRLMLAVDDAHLMDQGTWDLLVGMGGICNLYHREFSVMLATRPLIDIFTGTRTEAALTRELLGASFDRNEIERLKLQPFTRDEVIEVIDLLFGVDLAWPGDVVDHVQSVSQGNPFVCREIARAIHDQSIYNGSETAVISGWNITKMGRVAGVSPALETAIVARIDRLDPLEQEILKVASVIGNVFQLDCLHTILPRALTRPKRDGTASDFEVAIQELAECDLVHTHAVHPDESYAFTHDLVRMVTYSLVTKSKNKMYHKQVAKWIERKYFGDLRPYFVTLMYHYIVAGEPASSVKYANYGIKLAVTAGAMLEVVSIVERLLSLETKRSALRRVADTLKACLDKLGGEADMRNATENRRSSTSFNIRGTGGSMGMLEAANAGENNANSQAVGFQLDRGSPSSENVSQRSLALQQLKRRVTAGSMGNKVVPFDGTAGNDVSDANDSDAGTVTKREVVFLALQCIDHAIVEAPEDEDPVKASGSVANPTVKGPEKTATLDEKNSAVAVTNGCACNIL